MGWIETRAEFWKKGNIDRKKEMDTRWTQREHDGYPELNVLKSTMIGTHYYAAIEVKRNGIREKVFATTALTSVRDRYWFGYKDMDETMGPYLYECPKRILDLLTPTENESAIEWRENCRKTLEEKKTKGTLNSLPEGTVIEFDSPFDTSSGYKKGDKVRLTKRVKMHNYCTNRTTYMWANGYYRWSTKQIPDNWVVVEQ